MKRKCNLLLIVVCCAHPFLLTGCSDSTQAQIEAANKIIAHTQELIKEQDLNDVKIFVQVGRGTEPQRVLSVDYLKKVNYDIAYNVVLDNKKILAFIKVPFVESGDYKLVFSHYFDGEGRAIAYRRKVTFFNNNCSEKPIVSDKTIYYDKNGMAISKKGSVK